MSKIITLTFQKIPFKYQFFILFSAIVITASFHYGVIKHQTDGPEQLKNTEFTQGTKNWKLNTGKWSDLKIGQTDDGKIQIINQGKQPIELFQIIPNPQQKLLKIGANILVFPSLKDGLETNGGKNRLDNEYPLEFNFAYRRDKGNWRYHTMAKIIKTNRLSSHQKIYWIDKNMAGVKIGFKIPGSGTQMIFQSLSVQSVESKKIFGLTYHRLDRLMIVICCLILLWVVFSSFYQLPLYINLISGISAVLLIYLLKSSLGYDFFGGFSFGIWDWLKSL